MARSTSPTLISRDIIKAIHHRNKHLVFGFIRKINKTSHELVNYLCLLFFVQRNDELELFSKHFNIQNKAIIRRVTNFGFQSIYFKNVAKTGIHIWKFKFIENGFEDSIGIYDARQPIAIRYHYRHNNKHACSLNFKYRSFNHEPGMELDAFNCFGQDLIEMRLNLKKLTLSFYLDSEYHLKTYFIKNKSYRAFVKLSQINSAIKFLSYQYIC